MVQKLFDGETEMSVVDKKWQEYWKIRLENPLSDAETLKINSEGYLIELGKKPLSYEEIQGQYIGLIKVSKEQVLKFKEEYFSLDKEADYDGKNFDNMYMTSFIQHLINKGWQVKPAYIEGGWLEFDSIEDSNVYTDLLNKGELGRFFKMIDCIMKCNTL